MSQFTDALGRKWSLEITVLSVKKLREELQVDILKLADQPKDQYGKPEPGLLQQLATDEVLLVDVISVLLSKEIRERSLTEEQFVLGLVGDGIVRACDALIEAIVNFSQPQKGQLIKTVYSKVKLIESAACSKALTLTESPEINQAIENELETAIQKIKDNLLKKPTTTC